MKRRQEIMALLEEAREASRVAYCPYSGFHVGAVVVTRNGQKFRGCNMENSSYGLTVCAERVAVANAVASGCREFAAVAIVADGDEPPRPCGACRQVLGEFCDDAMPVYMAGADRLDRYECLPLGRLLPHRFQFGPSKRQSRIRGRLSGTRKDGAF